MIRALLGAQLGALVALCLCGPAAAHKLKVFATVEGAGVGGYAFFVGGGRARGSSWVARDTQGTQIAAGTTDDQGRFAFELPDAVTTDITVTIDTHEAHVASATLSAARLGIAAAAPGPAAPAPGAGAASRPLADGQVAALVEAAVQRQVEPLLERIEQMDSRLRLVDILSGIFFIVGLAGIALWARGRRA